MTGAVIITAAIAIFCLVYSLFAFQEKGPLLTTIYLVSSPGVRKKMDTKKSYRIVAVVFLGLAITFFSVSAGMLFNISWMPRVIIGFAVIICIYAIVVSVQYETR